MVVWLRRFLCVIQAFAMFICDENAVRKRQNGGAEMAVGGAISVEIHCVTAKWWCDCGGCVVRFGRFQP